MRKGPLCRLKAASRRRVLPGAGGEIHRSPGESIGIKGRDQPCDERCRARDCESPSQKAAFLRAVVLFVADLRDGRGFRRSLRVKKMAGYDDVWELTWAADGRATFEYGASVKEGHPHVRWRRIGTHALFKRP